MTKLLWKEVPEVYAAYVNGRDFRNVNLHNVSFEYYDEQIVNLEGADFGGCDLSTTKFCYCSLVNADFMGAELEGCEFTDCFFGDEPNIKTIMTMTVDNNIRAHVRRFSVNIKSNDISYCYSIWNIRKSLDTTGQELIGYKVVAAFEEGSVLAIAKLLIPAEAKRIVFKDSKCRCEKAKVLDIYSIDKTRHFAC